MKRDFQQPIVNLEGKPLKDEDGKPVTLCSVALNALLASIPNDIVTGEAKAKRYALALKINDHPGDVNVTAEELTLLKEQIGKIYAPLVVGRAYDLLEEKAVPVLKPVESIAKTGADNA